MSQLENAQGTKKAMLSISLLIHMLTILLLLPLYAFSFSTLVNCLLKFQ